MFQQSVSWRVMTTIVQRAQPAIAWDWTQARALCLAEAQRILGRSALAEDAAQEAVIRAWRRQPACRTPERPAPWIITIARREALRAVDQRPQELELPASGTTGSDELDPADDHAELMGAIRQLAESDRALVLARYWEDLPDDELARRFGIAETTVRVRLHRIRRRLRHTLLET
jgi:RNA polymerase sigma factor (sigma-70 family)